MSCLDLLLDPLRELVLESGSQDIGYPLLRNFWKLQVWFGKVFVYIRVVLIQPSSDFLDTETLVSIQK